MPSNHLILCRPLLLPPSIFPSIRVFSSELALCIRWSRYYWSFSVSPSNEYSGLISFRIDGFDLLAVQGTLKNLLQHHISKASILRHSPFFIVQFSHPYMTTGKIMVHIIPREFLAKIQLYVACDLHTNSNLHNNLHCWCIYSHLQKMNLGTELPKSAPIGSDTTVFNLLCLASKPVLPLNSSFYSIPWIALLWTRQRKWHVPLLIAPSKQVLRNTNECL